MTAPNPSTHNPLKTLVLAGAGLSLWMAAACVKRNLAAAGVEVIVVEDSRYGDTESRCEAGLPTDIAFLNNLGLDQGDVVARTRASYRLAQRYKGWSHAQQDYFLPFSDHGFQFDRLDFVQHALRAGARDAEFNFEHYSMAASAARAQRFLPGDSNPRSIYAGIVFGLQINTDTYRELLKQLALQAGVKLISGRINQVRLDTDTGELSALQLDAGFFTVGVESHLTDGLLVGDFFIDCTGAQSLLSGAALDTSFNSAETTLLANASASVLLENTGSAQQPYSQIAPETHGWSLESQTHRYRHIDYFFHAGSASCEQIIQDLNRFGDARETLRIRPLHLGWRAKPWHKNCLALGDASGDLGSFLFNKLYLVQTQLLRFINLFPAQRACALQAGEFNRQTLREYAAVRDVHSLHLQLCSTLNSNFWQAARKAPLSDELATRLSLFKQRGLFPFYEGDLLSPGVFSSLLLGNNVWPAEYHPLLAGSDEQAQVQLHKMQQMIARASQAMPSLASFLQSLPAHTGQQTVSTNRSGVFAEHRAAMGAGKNLVQSRG